MKWALILVVMYSGRFGNGWETSQVTSFADSKTCETARIALKEAEAYKNGTLYCQEVK